jgi:hypothetical protein
MALVDFLLEGAQERYFSSLMIIAERWDVMLGEDTFDGVNDYTFVDRVLRLLESGNYAGDFIVQVISDLGSISWWRGPHIGDVDAGRVAALARRLHLHGADSMSFRRATSPGRHPAGPCRLRRRSGPTAALALARRDRLCRRPGHGPAGRADRPAPRRRDQAQDAGLYRRAPGRRTTRAGPVPDLDGRTPTSWSTPSARGRAPIHFWCEPTMAPHITSPAAWARR